MTDAPIIVLLGGASETAQAAEWLAQASANAMVFWADEAIGKDLSIPRCLNLTAALADASGLVDTTHPFDTQTRSTAVQTAPHIPYARVWRAPWVAQPNDQWTEVDTIEDAVKALPPGARVFAATGRNSLPVLARHNGPVFLRQLKANTDLPPDNCKYILGTGPFDVAGEADLFTQLRIDVVLSRNVGAAGSFPKIAAARQMRLPVILLRPPALPEGTCVTSKTELAAWLATL